jgi:hypothetical protein
LLYHDEHLSHRVAIVVEVEDFEASPQVLWTWAYERSNELAGDLHRRGAEAVADHGKCRFAITENVGSA